MNVIKVAKGGAFYRVSFLFKNYNFRKQNITFRFMSTGLRLILKNG